MYKKDNYAGINPLNIDVPNFLTLITSKYYFVLFYILFQWVFSTTWVFVAGSFKDIFITKIKNITLTKQKGINH